MFGQALGEEKVLLSRSRYRSLETGKDSFSPEVLFEEHFSANTLRSHLVRRQVILGLVSDIISYECLVYCIKNNMQCINSTE